MLKQLQHRMGRGLSDAKAFMGRAYNLGSKFASTVDRHAGMIRRVVGAVAPMAGALTGPVGQAVGTGIGVAMRGLSAYDELKTQAMGQMNQAAQVAVATKRGLKY